MKPSEQERAHAQAHAAQHRRRAGEHFIEYHHTGDDAALGRARQEIELAERWERRASQAPQLQTKSGRGEAEEAGASAYTGRRAWILPGTISDDPLQQLQEANQSGLLGQLVTQATRSVFDKEHRTFENPKAIIRGGRAILNAAREHRAAQISHSHTDTRTPQSPDQTRTRTQDHQAPGRSRDREPQR